MRQRIKQVLVFLKCGSAFENEYTTSVLKKSWVGYVARFLSGMTYKVNDDRRNLQMQVRFCCGSNKNKQYRNVAFG